jgi:hypothetical protein
MLIQIESQFANYCMVQDNLICTKASIVPILQIKARWSAQEVQQSNTPKKNKKKNTHTSGTPKQI